ncbi:TonB-dependent siderophore receptor [Pseudomonas sp. LRF_L74]|uniref:TonB-dependent siderophore receptor n=1 Tax=Pseudomonas sp. LRF_L74 TaxID=3369422 RepID=UPI003F5F1559
MTRALRSALFGAAIGLAAPTSLLAAESGSSVSTQRFSIAAGPLADVLNQFARAAGITLASTPQQTAGKSSSGLQGDYSIDQALGQLLQGTNLEVVNHGNDSYVLSERVDAGAALELGATAISSTGLGSVTEGTSSYTTGTLSIGKTPQSLRRTPQSVSVLTAQRIEDQHLTNLTEMLYQTPGVAVDYVDSERVTYYARGYQIDAIQFDGARINQNAGAGNFIQPDAATIDHVEVLRGASGMLRGSGNPSGTVDIVRKRPTYDFKASGSYTLGSWNANRYVADVSGPLLEGGKIRGRFIAVHDDGDSFQDSKMERKSALYGVLAADLNEDTTVTAGLEYIDLETTGTWGNIPADFDGSALKMSRDTFLGANWNRWDRTNMRLFTELEHRFQNDWNLKVSASHSRFAFKDHGFQQTYIQRSSTTNPYLFNVSGTFNDGGGETLYDNFSSVLNGPFQLLGREHRLSVGAEYNEVDQTGTETGAVNLLSNVDIRTWNPSAIPRGTFTPSPASRTVTTEKAIFATLSLSLAEPLTAQLGARMNWYDYDIRTSATGDYRVSQEIVPYGALVYDLSDNLSAYASYTEIFAPQSSYDVSGSLLQPMTGEVYEVGLKGEYFEGRLNSAISVFRTNLIGKALADADAVNLACLPNNVVGSCMVSAGKSRSEGLEMELSGEILPDWQLSAGYTYTKTEYLKDSATNQGNALRTNDPKHQLRLFTSYRLPGQLSAWNIGAGVQAQSDIYATGTYNGRAVRAEQGGYAIYNAMLGYRFNDHYSVQFNANNIFDKYYYKKIGATGINYYYGDPRNFALTLRGEF